MIKNKISKQTTEKVIKESRVSELVHWKIELEDQIMKANELIEKINDEIKIKMGSD